MAIFMIFDQIFGIEFDR